MFSRCENITWRQLPQKLSLCDFLVKEGYLTTIPKKSKFNQVWNSIKDRNLESWTRMQGYHLSRENSTDLAVDSSGFEKRSDSIWRLVKWSKSLLCKTSELFIKVHISVTLPSRAIVSIVHTDTKIHDSKAFGPLWKRMYRRLSKMIKRVHADKGCWSENIINFLEQKNIDAVIPCKSNSKNHGTGSAMDQLVKVQKQLSGIYHKNYKTFLRAEVEHTFGNVKLTNPVLRDVKRENKITTLLCSFLWYNYKLHYRKVVI